VLTYLAPLVVLLNGLAAGVLFNSVLGGFPYLASLPDGRYVHAHAFYGTRYDPAMPICLIGTTLGDLVLAAIAPGTASRSLFLAAALLAGGTALVSAVKNAPVNRWMRTLDPENLPADFAERNPRRDWGVWNTRRTLLAMAALLCNCTALTTLL
jgi:uncharacterized membrane protein